MKKTTLFFLFCGLLGAQAGFVYQSGSSFATTADLDGDGRSDLVLVDGANATVRVGYQLSANTITWAAPRSLGMEEVTDISCGQFFSMYSEDLLIATAPALNRYNLYYLPTASDIPVPQAAYAAGIGPQSVAAIDIGGSGNTAEDDLFSVSVLNGSAPYRGAMIRSDGTAFSPIVDYQITSAWAHLNEIEYATGLFGLGVVDGSTFRVYDFSAGGISQIDYQSLGLFGAGYVSFIPDGDSYAQFLAWEPGDSVLKALAIIEPTAGNYDFSTLVSYDLGSPINSIQLVQGGGITQLAIIFDEGVGAAIFDYNGTGAPVLSQEIYPPQNELIAGFLPIGTDDLVMFSSASGDFCGAVTANQQTFSSGVFVSAGTQILPAIGSGGGAANVMTFEHEPFSTNMPHRLQLLRAGDWSSDSKITGGSVSATAETDSGITDGLGDAQTVALGSAHASAAYTLDNQLHEAISTYSFDAARGDELVGIIVDPDPGSYGTSIAVSFATDPSAAVYYRTGSSDSWNFYSAPFTLFEDTSVQYYAVGGTGQTIIREAAYTFADTPSDLDSDGDGVPDYVELANGLDPLESGLDADGDGFSDLDELLAGTNPTDDADFPVSRLEQGAVYDLALSLYPYDGVLNQTSRSEEGTQVRLFSAAGGLRSYAKAAIMTINEVVTIATRFDAISLSSKPPFLTAVSDPRYDIFGGGTDNQRGVELVGVYSQSDYTSIDIPYTYQGGALPDEAAGWLAAAQSAYASVERTLEEGSLGLDDTLAGLLIERKLSDLLYDRGVITNTATSLFKGRMADQTMPGFIASDLQSLETAGSGGEAAYHLPVLVSSIKATVSVMPNMRSLVQNVYDTCSDLGRLPENAGKYPLPVDVLRTFIDTGVLHSNYLASAIQTPAQRTLALSEVATALAAVPARTTESFTLAVRADSFDAACPVLYTGGSVAKSLYTATGNPFRFPTTFVLQPGAQVRVEAFTDASWNLCPGTDPLEVISLNLTAVPTASGTDADGNLIPDDYEALFLAGSGGLATSDLDEDGFSDLQEYLEKTDPADISNYPEVDAVDFSLPIVQISTPVDGQIQLDVDWPEAYADEFIFTVMQSTNLIDTTFGEDVELPRGSLSGSIDSSDNNAAFYQVQIKLR